MVASSRDTSHVYRGTDHGIQQQFTALRGLTWCLPSTINCSTPMSPAAALAATDVALVLTRGCSGDTAGCGPAVTVEISQADLYGSCAGPHGARLDLTPNGVTSVTCTVNDAEVGLAFSARGATVTELLFGKANGRSVLFARRGDSVECRVF
ncbi:hypothetical protein [Streptomyces sp. NPDC008141]|uniref:hypothetical protein n=1 Tax=Streptomyces sp. NPDC008141 TaxID=3364815 RepID=UPI0036E091BC